MAHCCRQGFSVDDFRIIEMSHSEKQVVATYNMTNNAMGLVNFILDATESVCDPPLMDYPIYIMDEEGNHVKQAKLVEVKLEDGSKVWTVVLTLDH
jgi:hypothetical protein